MNALHYYDQNGNVLTAIYQKDFKLVKILYNYKEIDRFDCFSTEEFVKFFLSKLNSIKGYKNNH
ncbi:MAG: hypothetical protein N3A67_09900 [Ignavibacteria bacterium]|nr:hypothetical protein [Ignavibacteria bacterium]